MSAGDDGVDAAQKIVVNQLRAKGYRVTTGTRLRRSTAGDEDYYHTIEIEW
jgi:hypothetical protein